MSRRCVVLVSLILLVLLALWWLVQSRQGIERPKDARPGQAPHSVVTTTPFRAPIRTNLPPPTAMQSLEQARQLHSQRQAAVTTSWLNSKNGRIDFWGLVVDQDDKPLEGVEVLLESRMWAAGFSLGAKFPQFRRTSGADGKFELIGAAGDVLDVKAIGKAGYRRSLEEQQGLTGFTYHGSSTQFIPDPANPYVFKLWKIKGAERLVYRQASVRIEVDGTIQRIDLLTGRVSLAGGHLELRLVRDPLEIVRNQRNGFSWRMEMSVPGGGLQWQQDRFGFEAPESGYQPSLVIGQASDDPEWRDVVEGEFYLRTAQGYHGRVQFRLNLHSQRPPCGLYLTSYLSPTGSRNLEYDSRMIYESADISANGVFQPQGTTAPRPYFRSPPIVLPPPDPGPEDLIRSFKPNPAIFGPPPPK